MVRIRSILNPHYDLDQRGLQKANVASIQNEYTGQLFAQDLDLRTLASLFSSVRHALGKHSEMRSA